MSHIPDEIKSLSTVISGTVVKNKSYAQLNLTAGLHIVTVKTWRSSGTMPDSGEIFPLTAIVNGGRQAGDIMVLNKFGTETVFRFGSHVPCDFEIVGSVSSASADTDHIAIYIDDQRWEQ